MHTPLAVLLALLVSVTAAGQSSNFRVLGNDDLGRRALSADVAVHRGFAYVGQWSYGRFFGGLPNGCLESIGVAVVDVRVPTAPEFAGTLPAPPFTSAEDVEVLTPTYGPAAGRTIALAGIQACSADRANGLMLWDATNPRSPSEVAFVNTGQHGVHELAVAERHDLKRSFAFGTVPHGASSVHGDVRIYDVTDPTAPVEIASWGVLKDLQREPASFQRGCHRATYAHGVEPSDDGKLLFVSYWDAGVIILDISNPAAPRYLGRTEYGESDEGNAHSADYDRARNLLFVQDEDLTFSCATTPRGFGYLRIYDVSDLASPRQIGSFRTHNSENSGDANYAVHHAVLVGNVLYTSWFADGIRAIDVSDPSSPREIGFFVPPPAPAPLEPVPQGWPTPATRVWGVAVDRSTGIIYASDYHSGLWILQHARPRRRAVRHR